MIYQLTNLTIGYRHGNDTKVVAKGINATLDGGRLTCLIGPNGAGKSTLLRTLAAFQPRLEGSIAINGKDISQYSRHRLARLIGVVLTGKVDVQNLTVAEMVALGRNPYTGFFGTLGDDDRQIVNKSMQQAGITGLKDHMVGTLSDGERQKVMIAKALAQQTPVIFLDEPTAFLDYPSKVATMQLLTQLAKDTGKTIFMSTHDMELALQMAGKLWLMDGSGNVLTGTPAQLAGQGHLSAFLDRRGIRFNPHDMHIEVCRQP